MGDANIRPTTDLGVGVSGIEIDALPSALLVHLVASEGEREAGGESLSCEAQVVCTSCLVRLNEPAAWFSCRSLRVYIVF